MTPKSMVSVDCSMALPPPGITLWRDKRAIKGGDIHQNPNRWRLTTVQYTAIAPAKEQFELSRKGQMCACEKKGGVFLIPTFYKIEHIYSIAIAISRLFFHLAPSAAALTSSNVSTLLNESPAISFCAVRDLNSRFEVERRSSVRSARSVTEGKWGSWERRDGAET